MAMGQKKNACDCAKFTIPKECKDFCDGITLKHKMNEFQLKEKGLNDTSIKRILDKRSTGKEFDLDKTVPDWREQIKRKEDRSKSPEK